jgi:hypothetical protein
MSVEYDAPSPSVKVAWQTPAPVPTMIGTAHSAPDTRVASTRHGPLSERTGISEGRHANTGATEASKRGQKHCEPPVPPIGQPATHMQIAVGAAIHPQRMP